MLVTGATPGSLGFATAQALLDRGARVVITTRTNTDAAVARLHGDVAGHPLDLADADSVQRFVNWYADEPDVLINNAGIHLDLRNKWPVPHRATDGLEIHWRTNYLGTMHLTHLLLPKLLAAAERTGDARVVMVVSKLHERGSNEFLFKPLEPYNSWDAYGLSKLALVHAATELAVRYGEAGLRAYSLHPGSVHTHIADRGLEGRRVIGALRRALAPIESRMLRSPEDGAQTTLHCATAPDLPSGYYRDCTAAPPSFEASDRAAAARLWDDTRKWVESLPS